MFLIVHVEVANREGKEKNDPKPKRDEISCWNGSKIDVSIFYIFWTLQLTFINEEGHALFHN